MEEISVNNDAYLTTKAIDLITRFDETFLELGALLRQVQGTNRKQFKQLLSLPGLGIRRAYYLIKIDRVFSPLQVPKVRLTAIGWTKLEIITAYLTPSNLEHLLLLAETNKATDLRRILRKGPSTPKGRSVLLDFTPSQYKTFVSQLLKHGAVKTGRQLLGKERALIKALLKNVS